MIFSYIFQFKNIYKNVNKQKAFRGILQQCRKESNNIFYSNATAFYKKAGGGKRRINLKRDFFFFNYLTEVDYIIKHIAGFF